MSLAPVVWDTKHGPIHSQFPKSMGSRKKLISTPPLEALQLQPTVQWAATNIIKVKDLTCWSHLNGLMGFEYKYPASGVCAKCVFVRHAGVLKVRSFLCQARRGRHCSCVEHLSMKPVTWNKRFFTEGGLCSPVSDKVQWMWVVLPGQLVVTSVGFLGRWSVVVDVEFVTLISFEVVVYLVLHQKPSTTEEIVVCHWICHWNWE